MPIKISCTCGKVLSVPGSTAGRAVTCPSCSATIVASSSGPGSGPAPGIDDELPPQSTYERNCPQCGAAMLAEAVICTRCGFDTRRGRFVSSDLGDRKRFNYAAIVGPIVAVVVIAIGIVVVPGLIEKASDHMEERKQKEQKPNRRRRRRREPEDTTEPEETPAESAAAAATMDFIGGEVTEEVVVAGGPQPYVLSELTTIAPGGRLVIQHGAVLQAAEGVAITLAGGSLAVLGTGDDPVVLAVPLSTVGPDSELEASFCVFAHTVSLVSAKKVAISNSTFTAGVSLVPADTGVPADWRLDHCEFHPKQKRTDPCLEVRTAVSRDSQRIWLRRCNYMGRVAGSVDTPASIDLARSYWDIGPASALENLTRKGKVIVEPISSHRIAAAGASHPSKLKGLLSPLGSELVPIDRERVLTNPAIGFEIVYPEGWRPAGKTMLTAPSRFKRARVTIEWHAGETLAVRLRSRMVVRLRKSGIKDVQASNGEPRTVDGSDALDFACTFASGGARWAERVVIVPRPSGSFTISLRGREGDMKGLAPALDAILKDFRALGEK